MASLATGSESSLSITERRAEINKVLLELGRDPNRIAFRLGSHNCQGIIGNNHDHPLVHWMRQSLPERSYQMWVQGRILFALTPEMVAIPLTPACCQFHEKFLTGSYPHLIRPRRVS